MGWAVIALSIVHLEDAALRVLVLIRISLVLDELLHGLLTLLLASLVHTALLAPLMHEVALLSSHGVSQVGVAMVVFLYLLCNPCSSHEAFFILVLGVGLVLVLYFSIPIKVLTGLDHLSVTSN
jgi:hypothetical protein